MNATCYHLRNINGVKVVGGSLGMSRDISLAEGAEQVARTLGVAVKGDGRVVFTHNGQQVDAYLSIDPSRTEKGRDALRTWRAEKALAEAAARAEETPCHCCGRGPE